MRFEGKWMELEQKKLLCVISARPRRTNTEFSLLQKVPSFRCFVLSV